MNIVDSSGGLAYFADEPNAKHFLAPLSNSDLLIVPSITIYKVFKVILRESFGQISDILITMIRKCGAPIFVTFLTEVALIVGGASCLWAKAQTKQLQTDSCDVAAADFRSKAISLVLAGGVVAAFVGPEMAKVGKDMIGSSPFAGGYILNRTPSSDKVGARMQTIGSIRSPSVL